MSGAHHAHLAHRSGLTQRAALASAAVALLLLVAKAYAAAQTGSMAMLASLADTTLDLLASLTTLWGVYHAAQPADHDHRFGHGKAEALAALAQIFLIGVSAVAILWRSIMAMIARAPTQQPELGIGVSVLAIAATVALLAYQRMVILRTGSVAIGTDHLHYQSDVALNLAVIAALALEALVPRLAGADALFGALIALWLIRGAVVSSREAIDQLMDREWPEARRARLIALVKAHPLLADLHDLRTRTSGTHDFIQFHLALDPDMPLKRVHELMDRAEDIIHAEFPHAEILIHPDPRGLDERHQTPLPVT